MLSVNSLKTCTHCSESIRQRYRKKKYIRAKTRSGDRSAITVPQNHHTKHPFIASKQLKLSKTSVELTEEYRSKEYKYQSTDEYIILLVTYQSIAELLKNRQHTNRHTMIPRWAYQRSWTYCFM